MTAVKQWSTMICFVAIALSIMDMLIPSEKMEKIIKLVLGCFLLLAIIMPLKKLSTLKINLNSRKSIDYSSFKESIKNQSMDAIKGRVERIIREKLAQENIVLKKSEIFMDTNKDNCISINKIQVYILSKDKTALTKKILEDSLGIQIEVLSEDT